MAASTLSIERTTAGSGAASGQRNEGDPGSWVDRARSLGICFAERSARHDREGEFVSANYDELKAAGLHSMAISRRFGGGGASYTEVCRTLGELARHCPSSALALSMHTHLVAASVFKLQRGAAEEGLQRRIAEEGLILVSTGATDWIDSNGTLTPVDGGYRVNARKVFASGSPAADVLVTTARLHDADDPEFVEVLHFPVPFSADGVHILDDWDTLGMRGTGSHTVEFRDVFVPAESIALRRPAGEWHAVWNVVLLVALPLILSVYRGIAQQARDLAVAAVSRRGPGQDLGEQTIASLGALETSLELTRTVVDAMVAEVDEYRADPGTRRSNRLLMLKTVAADAAQETVRRAMELSGGSGFFRRLEGVGVEQLFRDVQAVSYHPLPKARQRLFTGRLTLGLEPV